MPGFAISRNRSHLPGGLLSGGADTKVLREVRELVQHRQQLLLQRRVGTEGRGGRGEQPRREHGDEHHDLGQQRRLSLGVTISFYTFLHPQF